MPHDKQPPGVEFVSEWIKAGERITATRALHGGKEPAALAWLLAFTQKAVSGLSGAEYAVLLWEVRRFSFDGGIIGPDDPASAIVQHGTVISLTDENSRPTIERLQTALRTAIEEFLTNGMATLSIDGQIVIHSQSRGPGGFQGVHFEGRNTESSVYFMASHLLGRYGDRIRKCEGCGTLILAGRRDKRFCSQTCQVSTFIRLKRLKAKQAAGHRKKGVKHGTKGRR
jgi:hypothetical protein